MTKDQKQTEREAFEKWANTAGYDVAYTYDTDRSRHIWLNPMTADLWTAWTARAALSQPIGCTDDDGNAWAYNREGGKFAPNIKLYAAAPQVAQEEGAREQVVDDLAMMVRRLVRQLEKVDPGKDLGPQALDYLRRKGLQGSPLRDAPQPDAQQSSGKERSWLEIGKAVERACKELPEGAELHIELENGYGGARLYLDPVGDDDPGYVNDEWLGDEFADRINNAIEYAIEQKESE